MTSEHIYGNAENCPVCSQRDDIEYPWICRNPDAVLHDCGYAEDSFACKIRHLSINSGTAKANQSPTDGSRWQRAADVHNKKFS